MTEDKKSILLVDDEESILKGLGRELSCSGLDVSLASSGEDAINMLDSMQFDLVISDLMMEGIDGFEVLKHAKKNDNQLPVVILTGFGDMTSAVEALRLGADDYLLKPFNADELLIRVAHCIDKRSIANKLKMQKKKLADSEAQKTLLLNSAGEGIYGLDIQGRTTFINPAAENMLGYTAEEIIGQNSHPLIHHTKCDGTPYPKEQCKMLAAIKQKRKIQVTDELLYRKNGTSFLVEYTSTPIYEIGVVVGVVVVFKDITEKKEQEAKQRQIESHYQQIKKYQSLNSMAAGIAHNFNNILAAVIGNQELALGVIPAHQEGWNYVESAFKASQRAAKLSTLMLQFVGQAKIEKRRLEISEFSKEMINILRPQIKPDIELCWESVNKTYIKCDTRMIRQVIIELITNAAEAIGEEKGRISLSHGQRFFLDKELKQPYQQSELPVGEYAYLAVADNGPGMDSDTRDRVFEPFFTTRFTGRGMGLASILGIMHTHQGTILIESKEGKGSTVTIVFPAAAPPAPITKQVQKATPFVDNLSGTALLVDDEQMLRELGQTFLNIIGFEVIQAVDGLEALELFAQNMNVIDLILLDIAMPRLDGLGTLKKIREKSEVPVIMVTGYSIEQISDQFDTFTHVGLLQKPFGLKELKSKIQEMINPD